MKRMAVIFMILLLAACGRGKKDGIEISLMGEIPEGGEVRVELYGYDKMLADHKATLIVIHRERIPGDGKVNIEVPEDSMELIDPPVTSEENASYYIRVEIDDEGERYTQDYDRNPFVEVARDDRVEVYMKPAEGN